MDVQFQLLALIYQYCPLPVHPDTCNVTKHVRLIGKEGTQVKDKEVSEGQQIQ
jgi:hypothetical protein